MVVFQSSHSTWEIRSTRINSQTSRTIRFLALFGAGGRPTANGGVLSFRAYWRYRLSGAVKATRIVSIRTISATILVRPGRRDLATAMLPQIYGCPHASPADSFRLHPLGPGPTFRHPATQRDRGQSFHRSRSFSRPFCHVRASAASSPPGASVDLPETGRGSHCQSQQHPHICAAAFARRRPLWGSPPGSRSICADNWAPILTCAQRSHSPRPSLWFFRIRVLPIRQHRSVQRRIGVVSRFSCPGICAETGPISFVRDIAHVHSAPCHHKPITLLGLHGD